MAALFGSWWSGKSAEGEEEKNEESGQVEKEGSEKKDSSWMTGLEGKTCLIFRLLCLTNESR